MSQGEFGLQMNENVRNEESMEGKSPRRVGVRSILLTLLLFAAAAVIVNQTLLCITTITVIGNVNMSREEILQLAGFTGPVGYFSVNEDKVAEKINANRYLEYVKIEKEFPNKLTLYVNERIPCANMVVMGVQYITDEYGMVLEKESKAALDNGLIAVTGMQTKDIRVGRMVVCANSAQLEAYTTVMDELFVQEITSDISELNVTDPESLYLVTLDGYTVHLGNTDQLRAKVLTMRGVLRSLRDGGYDAGNLECSVPGYATYTPPAI